jgi:hypothetical protein
MLKARCVLLRLLVNDIFLPVIFVPAAAGGAVDCGKAEDEQKPRHFHRCFCCGDCYLATLPKKCRQSSN